MLHILNLYTFIYTYMLMLQIFNLVDIIFQMLRKRLGYILLAFLVGIQLQIMRFYLLSPSGHKRPHRENTFIWEKQDDGNKPRAMIGPSVMHMRTTIQPKRIIEESAIQDLLLDQNIDSRYLRDPEVNSILIDSQFNGTGICPRYVRYTRSHTFTLGNDTKQYFQQKGMVWCFVEGTKAFTRPNCTCNDGWYGVHCSIPSSVWFSDLPHKIMHLLKPRIRQRSRRIIHAMPFNMEFSMLEARLAELGDLVDVFLILESNYTAYGRHKPLRLLEMLCQGKYKEYSKKIVHIWLDYFPKSAYVNGWLIDKLQRNYISEYSLKYILRGCEDDDLFLLTDADELPARDTVLFLKTHDGYPQPVAYAYAHTIYGFFWNSGDHSAVPSILSIGVLKHVLQSQAYYIRGGIDAITSQTARLNSYLKSHPNERFRSWSFGNYTNPSGWHCSWCFDPEGIQNKLVSAQNGDFPRWGDFPDKLKKHYIRKLITTGTWFDDKTRYTPRRVVNSNYAPIYLLLHYGRYSTILDKPGDKVYPYKVNKL